MSTRKQIGKLITMLGSAIFVAFLAVTAFLYFAGASGTSRLSQILVSPDAIEKSTFTTQNEGYIFNKIEFELVDSGGKGWGRYAVSPESYEAFYERVSSLRSLAQIEDLLVKQFDQTPLTTLTIFVQGESREARLFQRVEFLSSGDLFRVELKLPRIGWAYFRSPGIYEEVVELFAPTAADER